MLALVERRRISSPVKVPSYIPRCTGIVIPYRAVGTENIGGNIWRNSDERLPCWEKALCSGASAVPSVQTFTVITTPSITAGGGIVSLPVRAN